MISEDTCTLQLGYILNFSHHMVNNSYMYVIQSQMQSTYILLIALSRIVCIFSSPDSKAHR